MIKPRRCVVPILVAAALMAATTAIASPQFETSFGVRYSTHDPGASTGLRTLITWTDPGAPNGVPKPIQSIVTKFPHGARFDTRALPACEASDDEVVSEGAAACPESSLLGTGHTSAAFASGGGFETDVTLFNAPGQIIVLVTFHGTTTVATEFRDEVKGRTLTVTPELPAGVSLTKLSLHFGPHSRMVGAQRRTYLTTPPECPAGGDWTIRGRFTYADASTQDLESTSPCA
jgi:hypothetical protein